VRKNPRTIRAFGKGRGERTKRISGKKKTDNPRKDSPIKKLKSLGTSKVENKKGNSERNRRKREGGQRVIQLVGEGGKDSSQKKNRKKGHLYAGCRWVMTQKRKRKGTGGKLDVGVQRCRNQIEIYLMRKRKKQGGRKGIGDQKKNWGNERWAGGSEKQRVCRQ